MTLFYDEFLCGTYIEKIVPFHIPFVTYPKVIWHPFEFSPSRVPRFARIFWTSQKTSPLMETQTDAMPSITGSNDPQ